MKLEHISTYLIKFEQNKLKKTHDSAVAKATVG